MVGAVLGDDLHAVRDAASDTVLDVVWDLDRLRLEPPAIYQFAVRGRGHGTHPSFSHGGSLLPRLRRQSCRSPIYFGSSIGCFRYKLHILIC